MHRLRLLLLVLLAWAASARPATAQITGGGSGGGSSLPGLGSLTNPGADRILFWDNSANSYQFLTLVGCSITNTTATCGAGTATSSGAANELQRTDNGGGFTTYPGTSCTNQFTRSLSVTGAATCASVNNADVGSSAAIAYSKLALTGAVLNADLAGSIQASKLVGTDITIVGTIATGVWSGTAVAFAKGGTGLTSASDDTVMVSSGSAWVAKALPDCDDGSGHLNYDTATNAFTCGTAGGGGGSVSDTAFDASWNGATTVAPSQNAVYDLVQTFCSITDPNATRVFGWDDTDNGCAQFILGGGLTYDHATHTLSADVTLTNAVTLTGKIINGGANTLTVLAATQLSGFVPIGNICTATNADNTHFLRGDCTWQTIAGGGDALVANPLSQFASTTCANMASVIASETGTCGAVVFSVGPTLSTAILNGVRTAFAAKTSNFSVGATDYGFAVDATGTNVTITATLPAATGVDGTVYEFVRTDNDLDGLVVIDGNGSDLVDNALTYSLGGNSSVTIKAIGGAWVVTSVAGPALSDPNADKLVYWHDSLAKLDYSAITVSSAAISGATINAASNSLQFPITWSLLPAACQGTTASSGFNNQATAGAAAACYGSTVIGATLNFADDGSTVIEAQFQFDIPDDWDGASVIFKGYWLSTATSGNVIWNIKGKCAGDNTALASSYGSTADTVTDATNANASRQNAWTITATTATNHSFAGCAAGDHFTGVLYRDPGGSDTLGATASILSFNVKFGLDK